ncbi:hypothetical protein SUGI_0882190 [Cryptomeria japonica]|nr:hypothetical protein SUGI_0882190 [Cryptomeria japonica]
MLREASVPCLDDKSSIITSTQITRRVLWSPFFFLIQELTDLQKCLRYSIQTNTTTILMSTGMLCSRLMLQSFFRRIGFFLRVNGEQLGCNSPVDGCTMLSIVLSPTLCCSEGL